MRPQKTRNRRPWTAEEDAVLAAYVRAKGVGRWNEVPRNTGLARTGQGCRSRWYNSLCPGLKDGIPFSRDEEIQLCRLHAAFGNKWSRIAAEMEGRSENAVRNYWFSHVSRCQQAGINVYPPEVQAVAGQSDLHQPRPYSNSQTSSLPQQPPPPPPPPYLLPIGYPNYPVVATHLTQPLGAVYPVTMAIAPPPTPPLPVMNEASSTSQFWTSLLSQSNQIVEQGMQPHPLPLPSRDETAFNEENQLLSSLLSLQPLPPALPMENATEFNEEDQPLTSIVPLSNQNVEQGRQPQPPALPMEFNEEGQGQPLTQLQPLSDQNVEQERRRPQPPALLLENAAELKEEGQPLTSLPPLLDQNAEQGMQPQSSALSFGSATEFYYDEFFGAFAVQES